MNRDSGRRGWSRSPALVMSSIDAYEQFNILTSCITILQRIGDVYFRANQVDALRLLHRFSGPYRQASRCSEDGQFIPRPGVALVKQPWAWSHR